MIPADRREAARSAEEQDLRILSHFEREFAFCEDYKSR